ncbi:sigma-70 family RNA polymerase sigma factor [Streptomyces rubradiris]|uniref:DNA-directed RNA polymerase sigma-70 factor n=1 Tax=Streptomyces rubradiris TaxID=285531 RepID=A0ABQ3RLB9_STRRR|nr:sigma-70 family RNA polymerase sigma factor [Streptomyces rubradiris]GHH10576.1 DNA-directed RNA polymerase sigma-70 factor [Streptomyces rubradiris]GHI56604.1 DNA-directed RNA polymerase sigma-70 factor [Streptomyces rubradiris]
MDARQSLADCFEENRRALLALSYRMLGSHEEAEDAVQETWLRLDRADTTAVRNLPGWLRTVTSRVCLDMLRSRQGRRQDHGEDDLGPANVATGEGDPEHEVLEAESVGLALLVVLNTLSPAERVAFVLHDMFGVPFDEIGGILDRSQTTAKKLASRARHKVRAPRERHLVEVDQHREVVAAFQIAACTGDTSIIASRLAPDVVRRADTAALSSGRPARLHGAGSVAHEISRFGGAARHSDLALIDGRVGLLVAPGGRLRLAVCFRIEGGLVKEYELVADPARLKCLCIRLLPAS